MASYDPATQSAAYPLDTLGPDPALSTGTGGYQFTAGDLTEVAMGIQVAPAAKTAAATLTSQEVVQGILTTSLSGNVDIALPLVVTSSAAPTVLGINDLVPSAKTNSAFDWYVINLTAATHVATITIGTGWTIVGSAAVAAATSAHFRARKTSATTWTLYRVS
jgi:hypothetical protein